MRHLIYIVILILCSCNDERSIESLEMNKVEGPCKLTYGSKEITSNGDTIRGKDTPLTKVLEYIRTKNTMGLTFVGFDKNFTEIMLNDQYIFQDTLSTNWSTAIAGGIEINLDKGKRNELTIKIDRCTCSFILPTDYLGAKVSYYWGTIWLSYDNNFDIYY